MITDARRCGAELITIAAAVAGTVESAVLGPHLHRLLTRPANDRSR